MLAEDLITKLKSIVKPYIQDEVAFDAMNEETNFINDLKINSANLVDVILDIEDEFDIVMANEDMEQMTTVKSAMLVVEAKLKAK